MKLITKFLLCIPTSIIFLYSSTVDIENRNGLSYQVINTDTFSGKKTTRYDNGQLKSENSFYNGKFYGLQTEYYDNGQLKSEMNYIYGKKDGKFSKWYINGQLKYKVNYSFGKPVGPHITYYSNKKIHSKKNFKNGKLNGLLTLWYINGQIKLKGNYINGKLTGILTYWYENGQINSKQRFKLGKLDFPKAIIVPIVNGTFEESSEAALKEFEDSNPITWWFKNGVRGKLKPNSLFRGPFFGLGDILKENNDNGLKKFEGSIKNGKLVGLFTQWYDNGQKRYEGTFENRKLVGKLSIWLSNGKLSTDKTSPKILQKIEKFFMDKNGRFTILLNGNKLQESNYKNGKKNGAFSTIKSFVSTSNLNENGIYIIKSNYKDDKLVGDFSVHSFFGKTTLKGNFKNGISNGIFTIWDNNGDITHDRSFIESHANLINRNGGFKTLVKGTTLFTSDEKVILWYENGQKHLEGKFKIQDGKPTQLLDMVDLKIWDTNGKITKNLSSIPLFLLKDTNGINIKVLINFNIKAKNGGSNQSIKIDTNFNNMLKD